MTLPNPQHVDILRYVLTMNMPETRDSDFTWKDYQGRVNNELAANLGNYVNRVVQFTHKNFGGVAPEVSQEVRSQVSGGSGTRQGPSRRVGEGQARTLMRFVFVTPRPIS